jgi:hypothetical protein
MSDVDVPARQGAALPYLPYPCANALQVTEAIGATDTEDSWQDALDESPDDYAAELRAAGVRS